MISTYLKEKEFIMHKLIYRLGDVNRLSEFARAPELTDKNTPWTEDELETIITDRYNPLFLREFFPWNNAQITTKGKFNFYRPETLLSPEINVICDVGEHNIIESIPGRPYGDFKITSLEDFSTRYCVLFYRVKQNPYIWDVRTLNSGEVYNINDPAENKHLFLFEGTLTINNMEYTGLKYIKIISPGEKVFTAKTSSIILYVRSEK